MGGEGISKIERMTAIPGMLTFGTATVVISKIVFQMTAPNRNGEDVEFEKPWFMNTMMFVGMCACLIVYEIQRLLNKKTDENKPLVDGKEVQAEPKGFFQRNKQYFQIFPPAMCDLVATGIQYMGFMFVPASVYQLMRGSMVLFSAILCRVFLKKHIKNYQIIAIFIILTGLSLVGLACLSSNTAGGKQHSSGEMLFGIILIVLSQVVQASQIVIEQFLLHDCTMPPALIVGTEGAWGLLVMCCGLLPLFQMIPGAEDTYDAFIQLGNNSGLVWAVAFYVFVILFYNLYGMRVTQQFTAVHRTILEALRTGCIWLVQLFIYYYVTKSMGERWVAWSWVQLGGFTLCLFGTFIYNNILKIPGLQEKPKFEQIPSQ